MRQINALRCYVRRLNRDCVELQFPARTRRVTIPQRIAEQPSTRKPSFPSSCPAKHIPPTSFDMSEHDSQPDDSAETLGNQDESAPSKNPYASPEPGAEPKSQEETPVSTKNLGRATASAGVYTVIAQVGTTVMKMAGLYVLARLLDVEAFGLIAQVASIVGLTTLIGDFGVSLPIIQSKTISQKQLSSLFWVIICIGLALALIVCALAPGIAWFYGDPRVVPVTLMSALTLLFRTPSAHHAALLRRRLRFARLATVEITAAVTSVVVGIAFAKLGFGYWSLLYQALTFAVTFTLGSWVATGWFPDWYFSFAEIKSKLKMGGNFTAGTFLNYFARNADNILIARVWGPGDLGLYTKAYGLLLLPLQQIGGPMSKVAVPALSRLQDDPKRYKAFFYKGCTISFILQIPITIFAAIAAHQIVLVLLGPKWVLAVPIFFALTPTLFVATTGPATSWVFLSRGETDRWLKMVVLNSTMTILAFFVGVRFGAVAVAWAFSIVSVILRIPNIIYCFKPTNLKISEFFVLMIPAIVCSAAAGLAAQAAFYVTGWTNPLACLFLKAIVFFLVYVALIATTSSGQTCFETIRPYLPKTALLGTRA